VAEFRDVTSVDGKPIPGRQRTPAEFFSQIQKAGSVEKELEKVQKESLRFDKTLEIQGLTLWQAPVLADHLRPFFDFQLIGRETIGGTDMYVVSYRQTKKSPYVLINEKGGNSKELSLSFELDLPGSIRRSNIYLSGQLWIDAETFQLRRESRELTAQTENPVRLLTGEFEYQPGQYGFLVPKRILLVNYDLKHVKKNSLPAVEGTQVIFEYSQFTKTNVEVKVLDDEQQGSQASRISTFVSIRCFGISAGK
jgi:hypothetical protein